MPDPRRNRRNRRFPRFALLTMLALFGVAGIVLLVFIWRLRRIPPPIPVDTSPAAVRQAEHQVVQVHETLQKARQAQKAGERQSYRVAVRQDDLNTLLATDPKIKRLLREKNVERPRLVFTNDHLRASAVITFRGQRAFVTAEGPVTVGADGMASFQPEEVWIGDVRAPQTITAEIAKKAADAVRTGDLKLPGQVKSVRMENGQLVVEGSTEGIARG